MLLFIRDNVVIAKVDADAHRSLGEKFDVKGFPTLKWFPAGSTEPQDYDGPRDAPGIVKYINGKTGELGCAFLRPFSQRSLGCGVGYSLMLCLWMHYHPSRIK